MTTGHARDVFYTPDDIANLMVQQIRGNGARYIADFSAGDGGLLTAAARRFPSANLVATDVDRRVVSRLQRTHEHWTVGRCDFLSEASRKRCHATNSLVGRCSVILLNPPFSCRGAAYWSASVGGQEFNCSHAMAFLANALPMLSATGQIVALMPTGSLASNKDETAWDLLRSRFCVEVLSEHDKRTFDGCYPTTALIRISSPQKNRGKIGRVCSRAEELAFVNRDEVRIRAAIVRGWIPMHSLSSRKGRPLPLIHSKDLTADVIKSGRRFARSLRVINGPAVLVPRVGQPSESNVCVLPHGASVVLSDCVIAIKTGSVADARRIHARLHQHWDVVRKLYGGTCARYITLAKLRKALALLGVDECTIDRVAARSRLAA